MKKIIKVFTLMVLIALFFGITTSNAANLTVTEGTSAQDMLNYLSSDTTNNYLTGISNAVRRENAYLFCRQHGQPIKEVAKYQFRNGTADNSKKVYPGTDANGYARAYILAAPGYDKDNIGDRSFDRQWAWWNLPAEQGKQETEKNSLYEIAMDYQDYKKTEVPTTVDYSKAKSNVSVEQQTITYGPIKVQYSYMESSHGGKTEKFGGFDFAFYNGNTNIVDSSVAKLCIEDKKIPVTSTAITKEDGSVYYQVRTDNYNNKELYLVIDISNSTLKGVSEITLKIKDNKVDYTAEVYEIVGVYTGTTSYTAYCTACEDRMDNATSTYTNAINNTKILYKRNGSYYKYSSTESKSVAVKGGSSSPKNQLVLGSTTVDTSETATLIGQITKYYNDANPDVEYDGKNAAGRGYTYTGTAYKCNACDFTNTSQTEMEKHEDSHVHVRIYNKYSRKQYKFTKYNGCGCATKIEQGHKYDSQALFIPVPKVEKGSTEVEMDIPLIPPVRIELGKYNSYGATTHTGLTGAEYTVQAMQNGAIIYSKAGLKSGETIDIMPTSYDNVYVKITETKSPNGYIKIETPINAVMIIDGAKTQWYPSFGPTEEAWSASGFESSTWGGWTYIDDGSTALPNDYISKNGDYVNVSVTSGNGSFAFKVSAYNEPKINKLELSKVDGTSNAVLAGAKFKATLANVKTITINGQKIEVTAETEINLETDVNGKCLIDSIKLIDENEPVIITVTEVQAPSSNTEDYYYKKLDSQIVITVKHTPNGLQAECSYEGIEAVTAVKKSDDNYSVSVTIPNTRVIDIGGKVWLDGQTGIKPAVTPNGNIDSNEQLLSGIKVKLYEEGEESSIQETKTDSNGEYKFEGVLIGKSYKVVFEYDGINYKSTVLGGDSKADENETERTNFNNKFTTINHNEAIGTNGEKTSLEYLYWEQQGKSELITSKKTVVGTFIPTQFKMTSSTAEVLDGYITLNKTTTDLNLGLVKRGADLALSTDVYTANVNINGEETEYLYNKEDNSIIIDNTPENEEVTYNLNLYASDYNYRIKNYFSNEAFTSEDYVNGGNPEGVTTGDDLEVFVTYKLNLQNQSPETTKINEVKYTFDNKYTFIGLTDNTYTVQQLENVLTINLNGLTLADGETKTLYLVFKVTEVDNVINTGDFYNSAEITSYSTDKGLIDQDSQPGNFVADNQNEDDNDTATGIKIQVIEATERLISGKVFDKENNNVNDVIVQLIELKEVNGKVYEYIWQETVSGTDNGKRVKTSGTELESYTYTKADGYYEFKGFIPGDYIVRFIYGDGTTYDMTGNVIKYNGQDYKSMPDSNYNAEWYNSSTYTEGASVARDNEARRLETMAYSVEIDAEKGLLLKLLDNKELNQTEKETLISIYNKYNDAYGTSDITIADVTDDVINAIKVLLLKKEVLPNTWMCAETSKIKVAVATEDATDVDGETQVNGKDTTNHISIIPNINLGLELRPETKIELKKYITGFKLVAANGQELVDAYIDVNEYLNGTTDISSQVKGLKDNLTILGTKWQYEVPPTEINTKIEGAKLEFEYTLVVENTGANDYLSETLASAYETKTIGQYRDELKANGANVKTAIKNGSYNIGSYLGANYYVGGEGTSKVKTEVTNIRDYVNNDLTFIFDMQGDVAQNTSYSQDNPLVHHTLNDRHEMQSTAIKTVLETTRSTGKMANTDKEVMYTITLGKDPISVTAQNGLEFENYIAEVMSYTNAAGRRTMRATPGNAEIIDHEHRTGKVHEIDEADTAKIQIGAATGEDEVTNYIIIIAAAAGIALVAIGAFVIKKYIIK